LAGWRIALFVTTLASAGTVFATHNWRLGALYARDGLLDEAELELRKLMRANPNTEIARRLLANVKAICN
jgi:hypothetical protein